MTCRRAGAALALWAAAALALSGAAQAASWRAPVRLAGPYSNDLGPVGLAVSGSGEVAAGFSRFDEDRSAGSEAWLAVGSDRGGRSSVRRVPGARQVLDLGFRGSALELLSGSSPAGLACCSAAALRAFDRGRFGGAHRVASRLTGAASGSVQALADGRLVAAVATDRGVWVARSGRDGRLGGARRLGARGAVPWALAGGAGGVVGWLAAPDASGESAPTELLVAGGSPLRGRVLVSARAGHELDELALAPGSGGGVSVAWVDAWFDSSGAYKSVVQVGDVGRGRVRPRALAVSGQTASGLALAGAGSGDQVVTFKSCDVNGDCWVRASFRRAHGRFGPVVRLGAIDPGQDPAAAVTGDGVAVVGWVSGGRVFAVTQAASGGGFSRVRRLSPTHYAADLALAGGAGGEAVAAWTQGTLHPSVVAAVLR